MSGCPTPPWVTVPFNPRPEGTPKPVSLPPRLLPSAAGVFSRFNCCNFATKKEPDPMKARKTVPVMALATMFSAIGAIAAAQTTGVTELLAEPATTATIDLLTLPPVSESDFEGAPLKSPSLADDFPTTLPAVPDIKRPVIYWGEVGGDGGYSIDSVMNLAWKANPNWSTFAANHAAAHAALVEACAFPNPELDMEFGSEDSDETGESRSIWSLGFSQPIELPGKRAARQAEALAGFPVVAGEQFEYANALRADVREAYWTTQYHAALEQMYSTQVSLTQSQYDLVLQRVELGDAGKIELTNARVELLKAQREHEVARRRKLGAMAALDALTGGHLGRTFRLRLNFPHDYGRPSLDTAIRAALSAHPQLARLAAELEQKYASIQRQNREWWPDLSIGARKSKEFDGDSAAVTAAIEIPLWNRNEGGIAKAEAEAQKVYSQIAIAYNDLRRDVEVAYQNLMIARAQIESYDEGLREAAEEAVNLTWEQFNLGGGGYIDILIARRQLIETQQGYIQALYDAATAKARFDRAVGR